MRPFLCLVLIFFSSGLLAQNLNLKEKTRDLISGGTLLSEIAKLDSNNAVRPDGIGTYIVGGNNASRNQFQEYVLLLFYDFGGNLESSCGGTLIANNKVLTAAHCTFLKASFNTVAIPGFYSFNDPPANYEIFSVSDIEDHPSYVFSGYDYDIAVVTLDGNASTRTVPVYAGSSTLSGSSSTIIGLGQTSERDTTGPTVLRRATVPVVSNGVCNASQSGSVTNINSRMLCAGLRNGGVGTCYGDSGGPLYVTRNGQRIQAAITSFGIGCARANAYGVYSRVSAYVSFIRQNARNAVFYTDPRPSPTPSPGSSNGKNIAPIITLLLDDE